MASSSSVHPVRARAWVLNAEFDIAEHPQLANPDTNQIFPEYVKGIIHGRSPYLAHNMKGTTLISFSMPTVLSSLSNRDVVPVLGIFHGSHAVSMGTVQALFGNIRGLTATWGDLRFGPGETYRSFNEHPALLAFLRQSSIGGIDRSLWCRVDYMGVSDSRQPTTSRNEERGRAWRFEAMIDVAHHKGLIDAQGDISSEYFRLHILQGIADWETTIEQWDLVCYSVHRNIRCLQNSDSVPVVGFFRHKTQNRRRNFMQAMLSGIYGLTVNWTAVTLGPGRSLASHADYQAFLKASTQDQDSNPNLMARVDVKAPDAPPRRRGPAVGSVRSRPPLAPLDSLLNAIGSEATALPEFRTLADSAAKTTASRARALPALPAPPAAAPTPPAALAAQVRIAPPRPARPRLSRPPARPRPHPRPLPASARLSRPPARPRRLARGASRPPAPALIPPAPGAGPSVADMRRASSAARHAGGATAQPLARVWGGRINATQHDGRAVHAAGFVEWRGHSRRAADADAQHAPVAGQRRPPPFPITLSTPPPSPASPLPRAEPPHCTAPWALPLAHREGVA